MSKLVEMFQQDFMINVLAGTMIVAAICSYLGVFIVLRRAVFVGAALAQVSSLGVALALFLTGILESWHGMHAELPPQPIALALTVVAAVAMAAQRREGHLPRETLIGVSYAAASGLAILVVAVSTHAESEVLNLMFGNVLAIDSGEVFLLAMLGLSVAIVHAVFFKEFVFVSFDPDMATALGVNARLWNVVLFLTIGVTISLAIRAAGALVVFDFLVLPAATALVLGRSIRFAFATAIVVGVASSVAGISISYVADLPSGPTIVAVSTAVLLTVMAGRKLAT
ncbi:MAG TPA: metal ABC transporter permease [Candidatus Limnocylindrales bacterium]|nr:metal ABC transporter permease [Candidatus Limnocylindrales bacterium]